MQEQFTYAYDKSWNLTSRTKNAFVESFDVNNLNEINSVSNSGTLTVAGSVSQAPSSVTVSGTGFSSAASADVYDDNSWARDGDQWQQLVHVKGSVLEL